MRKEDVIEALNKVEDYLIKLRREIAKISTSNVNKKEIKDSIQDLCKFWFEEIESPLQRFGISDDIKRKYHGFFTNLLELALKISRKITYLKKIDDILF